MDMWLHPSHRELWGVYRRAIGDAPLPRPFDAVELIARLAERRGRPIELIPVAARPDVPCGLLMVTDSADCILYASDTSALHQQHILLHEAAHLLCGHDRSAGPDPSGAQGLLPHLPGALLRRVLGRTVYSEPQEHEAELLASLIRYRAARDDRDPDPTDGQQRRLSSVFGVPARRSARRG
ncbi:MULTISPECIES: ParH-like protein [unclassified Streptomyces]|uniref:ParH-like protein n=1 Tax=unclassified Streptomyces TaxID=2593676 RepID=UPI002E2829E6|nr:ParH-like protein [Streptomyces sp. NBC_00223]